MSRAGVMAVGGSVRVGISGWQYPRWRGDFYPKGLAHKDELAYVAASFSTLEVNGTFYALGRPATFLRWREVVPADCLLALKGGRFVTHMKRLQGVRVPLANFFASGVLALDDRLGPLLWQLPESLPFDPPLLEAFLRLLPRDTRDARRLGREATLAPERTWLDERPVRPLRHALEVRHASYDDADFRALLREHGVALVVSDSAGTWPLFDDVTARLVYVRLHGHTRLYGGSYPDRVLRGWAERATRWAEAGLDVVAYFDNDADGRAPFDARRLADLVGDHPAVPEGVPGTEPGITSRRSAQAPTGTGRPS